MARQTGLGKGLEALIGDYNLEQEASKATSEIRIIDIEPNKDQPRKSINKDKLENLADSIKQHGIIQPILVRQMSDDSYKIIAGERRWRAAKIAGLKTIPAIVRDSVGSEIAEIALIENLQREDLNPIEEALGYRTLMDEHNFTQEKLSERLGVNRSSIANSLRLLNLTSEVRDLLISGDISEGHAKVLLKLTDEKQQEAAAEQIIIEQLSVRETEKLIERILTDKPEPKPKDENVSAQIEAMEKDISTMLGLGVKIYSKKNKGRIVLHYNSPEEFEQFYNMLKGNGE